MKILTHKMYIFSIVMLILWIALTIFNVWAVFVNSGSGSAFVILSVLLAIWSAWNSYRNWKEIQEYRENRKASVNG